MKNVKITLTNSEDLVDDQYWFKELSDEKYEALKDILLNISEILNK